MIKIEELEQVTTKAVDEMNALVKQLSSSDPHVTYASLLAASKDSAVTILVILDGKKIVGTGSLYVYHTLDDMRGKLGDIVVDETYRGQGLGEQLIRRLLDLARKLKVTRLDLTSRASRTAAHKLYEKVGFAKYDTNVYRMKL